LTDVEQVSRFPAGLRPIQADDTDRELTAMGRPALHVRVEVGDRTIDLVTCHLKSKLLSYPDGRFAPRDEGERARFGVFALNRRAAEAATVRDRVTSLLDEQGQLRPLIVLGDLNDEPLAATTQILYGPTGSEIGTGGFAYPDKGDRQRLWNLAAFIAEEQRFTRIYQGRRELIDHLLVSHAIVSVVAEGDVTVIDTGAPSINDSPSSRLTDAGSDHRPVFVDVAF
jgi:endonuclease/exonuclease/phosphatase family metal-dependent hydrolase